MAKEPFCLVVSDDGGEEGRIRFAKSGERVRLSVWDRDDIVAVSMTGEQALELARLLLLCVNDTEE